MSRFPRPALIVAAAAALSSLSRPISAFVCAPYRPAARRAPSRLYMSATLPDVGSMRAGEIKKELESYGISTRAFLEKSELVSALEKARDEGMKPKAEEPQRSSSTPTSAPPTASATSSDSGSSLPREERISKEMEDLQSMRVAELRKELQGLGVSTKSFFEKSELVKALAEARVDGVKKSSGGGNDSEEGYAEYTDVEVLTSDDAGPRKSSEQAQKSAGSGVSPFGGGGGNPFGGAGAGASPFGGGGGGGMGGMDMGGIQDMLKVSSVSRRWIRDPDLIS